MACNTFSIPTSPASNSKDLSRSKSSKDLRSRATMQRSRSDNHLGLCSIDHIRSAPTRPRLKNSQSVGVFSANKYLFLSNSLKSFTFDAETSRDMSIVEKEASSVVDNNHDHEDDQDNNGDHDQDVIKKRANWVERLMELRTRWRNTHQQQQQQQGQKDVDETMDEEEMISDCNCDGCEVSYDEEEDGEEISVDRERFSRFLVRVPWSDVKLFSQLAFLCNIAYVIPDIKPKDLKRRFGLKFVTSSLERKSEAAKTKAKIVEDSSDHESQTSSTASRVPQQQDNPGYSGHNNKKRSTTTTRASVAYGIAASAASYVQSGGVEEGMAACVAASTMTAVVAAGEREKSEAAEDLRSLHSSPCEWFVCDDPSTYTRCFVIQGSDSLASWQANLFFEPTKFEETECLVHRGIYEAAKGMYTQFMPEIIEHLAKHNERAKLRFTGHSLGGSLSLLVHLMLLRRKAVKPSVLLPVVTFGSPFVFCGGHKILQDLGMDETQIHCVMMHRDIVPRAFSCNYPNHVANVLKRLNGTFRSHPCLIQNKFLYSPIGKLFLLQPDESSSPAHPLLPQGCSLYALDKAKGIGYSSSILRAFLNTPHPLETLSDPTAYGSEGTILRDHDSSNYLKAVNGVLKRYNSYNNYNYNYVVKDNNNYINNGSNVLWPLLSSPSPRSWSHESNVSERLNNKEVMTGV